MKRECLQKFLSGFFVFCITLSFSISSFAAAFTGAYMTTEIDPVTGIPTTVIKDVNPTGQTYSGQNVVEMNAYNNAPTLTNNTFNGSTEINPDFTSITSTGNAYNGSVDINYDGLGGTLDSNGDRFQSTTVTAQQSDISISNGTFNGTTNINAQSVSLGSITQMDQLLNKIDQLIDGVFTLYLYLGPQRTQTSGNQYTQTSWSGNQVTIQLNSTREPYISYNSSTHTFTKQNVLQVDGNGNTIYGNYRYQMNCWFTGIIDSFYSIGQFLSDLWSMLSWPTNYPIYSFTESGETYSISSSSQTTTFHEVLLNRIQIIYCLLNYFCKHFYEWYYPLDSTAPYYWRYYNTDTELQEAIGLAGLWYNISWYLGEIYQNLTDAGTDMTQDAQLLGSSISALNTAEESVNTQIQSAFSTVSGIMTLPVISAAALCISWIEYMWISLGIFQSPTLLAYMCVILMMLVGFAKYRSAFR